MSRYGALASQAFAGEIAREVLEKKGSAVDAVFGGFFAHAVADAGVALAPMGLLVGGSGTSPRVFDGRALQPGKGHARPRGFLDVSAVPPAARAATPRSVVTFAVAHARYGRIGAGQVVRAALHGSEGRTSLEHRAERIAFLDRVGKLGALAMNRDEVREPIVARLGPSEGGLLSAEDLAEATPGEAPASQKRLAGGHVHRLPFAGAQKTSAVPDAVVARDGYGLLAVLLYERITWGIVVPEIGALLPAVAEPVLRGHERLKPGSPLPMRAPAAICERPDGFHVGAFVADGRDLEDDEWAPAFAPAIDEAFGQAAAEAARAGGGTYRVAGLLAGDGGVRPFGSVSA